MILDPFCGTGKIARLRQWLPEADFFGYEIEKEWADQARVAGCRCITGDSRDMAYGAATFDAICTSPTYGNRMADHHEARERCKACAGKGVWCALHNTGMHVAGHTPTLECGAHMAICPKCRGEGTTTTFATTTATCSAGR